MAQENETKELEEVETEQKPKKNKLLLVVGAIIILLFAVQTGLVVSMYLSSKEPAEKQTAQEDEEEALVEEEFDTEYYTLEEMILNLKTTGSSDRYLRATINFEYKLEKDEELAVKFEEKLIKLQHEIIRLVRTKTTEEVRSVEGLDALSEEIRLLANEMLKTDSIIAVNFTRFSSN